MQIYLKILIGLIAEVNNCPTYTLHQLFIYMLDTNNKYEAEGFFFFFQRFIL